VTELIQIFFGHSENSVFERKKTEKNLSLFALHIILSFKLFALHIILLFISLIIALYPH